MVLKTRSRSKSFRPFFLACSSHNKFLIFSLLCRASVCFFARLLFSFSSFSNKAKDGPRRRCARAAIGPLWEDDTRPGRSGRVEERGGSVTEHPHQAQVVRHPRHRRGGRGHHRCRCVDWRDRVRSRAAADAVSFFLSLSAFFRRNWLASGCRASFVVVVVVYFLFLLQKASKTRATFEPKKNYILLSNNVIASH